MNILIESPFTTLSGYGHRSYDFINAFIELYPNENIYLRPLGWGGCEHKKLLPEKELHLLQRTYTSPEDPADIDLYIFIGIGTECKRKGKFNVLITAGIETNMVSPLWLIKSNEMDLILVSSEFSKQGYLNAKYKQLDEKTKEVIANIELVTEIKVLFEGYHPEIFYKTKNQNETIKNIFDQIDTSFNFMFIGTWLPGELGQDRKDIGMLIKTFMSTFKYKEETNVPGLILKTAGASINQIDKQRIEDMINGVKKILTDEYPDYNFPPVYLAYGNLTEEELNQFYNHDKIKSYVSFTKGEGYNRTPLEFIPTKKPIIISNHSGHLDYLNGSGSILLSGKLTQVHQSVVWPGVIEKDSKWFTVDYEQASIKMKDVFENYARYKDRTRMQKNDNFTFEKMKERIKDIFDKLIIKE